MGKLVGESVGCPESVGLAVGARIGDGVGLVGNFVGRVVGVYYIYRLYLLFLLCFRCNNKCTTLCSGYYYLFVI